MKALVAIKQVVDYNVHVRVRSDESGVETASVKLSMNPFDEIAVEEAVRLQEKGTITEIIAVTVGPQGASEILRTALALGAGRAIHVLHNDPLEPLNVAKILRKIVEKESPDLVLMGKQAIDDDCNQTGQMLAGLLNWPQGTFASKIDVEEKQVSVTREIDGGLEAIQLKLPAILTTDLRLNKPRYATLPNIMKARQKPLETLALEDLGVNCAPRQKVLKVTAPKPRQGGIKVENVAALVEKLREEAGVL
ncbi:MAG: electron transfer flavoprotein subunit beta/FixA family protein [bacterium]|nr:electron transfer flavoprotein subunit beta/FixA family protein [bacterium]